MSQGMVAAISKIRCGNKSLLLDQPKIMGILNLTPDSFFDGGKYNSIDSALWRVEEMIQEGADIIDLGAESSRPYATDVSSQEEIDRLMSILSAIKTRFDTILSVDTYKPEVMQEVIKVGIHIINDIFALQQPGALEAVADSEVAVCLMHMQGTPDSMQNAPYYSHIVTDVYNFLHMRIQHCLASGIKKDKIIVDPGFGFGKNTQHNMMLLRNLSHLKRIGFPLLIGLSRKASIGELLGLPVEERLFGSISAQVIAAMQGAAIIRTHDIKQTAQAIKIVTAVLAQEKLACQ